MKKGDTFSAHPRFDSKNQRIISFSSNQKADKAEITIHEFNNDLKVHKQIKVDIPGFVFFHDFIVTENYYIFDRAPVKFDPIPFILGMKGPAECISFDGSKPAVLFIVPRDGSPVFEVPVDAHFNFHFSNGYEDKNGDIIFDVVYCDKMVISPTKDRKKPVWIDLDYAKDVPYSTLIRFTLSKDSISNKWKHTTKQISSTQLDFPSINPSVSCQKNRYVYANCGSSNVVSTPIQGVVKFDLEKMTETKWIGEPYEFLGEVVYAPRKNKKTPENNSSDGAEEDDGYLLSYLFNGKTKTSEFVIFDAKDVSKGPISRQLTPTNIPYGFHGSFIPNLTFNPEEVTRRFKVIFY